MYPHDYYDEHHDPHMHNRHEGRPYLEPDWHANDHDAQLPALSAIGRGPRGEGLKVGNIVNEKGTVSFALYSDLTDELLWQSPNLDPGELTFLTVDYRDLVPGVHAPLDIVYSKGGVTKTTTAYLPAGDRGSLVYLYPNTIERNLSDTYQITAGDLSVYGRNNYPSKPMPRVNDIVFYKYSKGKETGIAFGTIEEVGGSDPAEVTPESPVVFTAKTFVAVAPVSLSETGTWVINGEDTGVDSHGIQGIQGEPGEPFNLQQGPISLSELPDFNETEIGTAYIVVADGRHDLYFRAKEPASSSEPWTIFTDLLSYEKMSHVPLVQSNNKLISTSGRLPVEWGSAELATVQGYNTIASYPYAHAEGMNTTASGFESHAEGSGTTASNIASHAEGQDTRASGYSAHAEGNKAVASDSYAHAEGSYCEATAYGAHAEGNNTKATATAAHAEGDNTVANKEEAHAEGKYTNATGLYAHSEGSWVTASGEASHAEGSGNTASGNYSHAEGRGNEASAQSAHAEGDDTKALGSYSHAEGHSTKADTTSAHAEGNGTQALGYASHAEGTDSKTLAPASSGHAEGYNTQSKAQAAHAEGYYSEASSLYSHSEGGYTKATGNSAHAEGYYSEANGNYSHAEGFWTLANSNYQHVSGKFNVADPSSQYLEIVGNGSNNVSRSNARTLDNDGNAWFAGDVMATETVLENGVEKTVLHKLSEKMDANHLPDMSSYATKQYVDDAIDAALGVILNGSY